MNLTTWPSLLTLLVLPDVCSTLTERAYEEPTNGGGSTRVEAIIVTFHQMPVPSTTWIGIGPGGLGSTFETKLEEWVGFTPGSIQLMKHNGEYEEWQPQGFTGYPSTGMTGDKFSAVSYSQEAGQSYQENGGTITKPHSTINVGFTSYTIKEEMTLKDQAFFIQTPGWLRYVLPACPNYAVGQTSVSPCPSRTMQPGEWKFSVLGLLSGTDINSLNSAHPPSGAACTDTANTCHPSVKKDIANYKEIVYRTILDVGGMGADAEVYIEKDGTKTPIGSVTGAQNIADYTLNVKGTKNDKPVPISFAKTYSTGTWTRDWSELTCTKQQSDAQCSSNQCSFGACTRDVTGFTSSDDAFAGDNGDNTFQKAAKGSNGAPVLTTTEVKEVNITIRAASMGARPATPGTCTGTPGTHCWPNAPADAPWWYTSKWNDPGSGMERWAGNEEFQGYLHDRDKVMRCETGYCFFIDFHFQLGGTTEGSRTALGNVPNDLSTGISQGTFFVYDPTVDAGKAPLDPIWILIGLGAACCCCCCFGSCVLCFFRRRRGGQRHQKSIERQKLTDGDTVQIQIGRPTANASE